MNKKVIRLTEQDLHKIINESVNKILNEVYGNLKGQDSPRDVNDEPFEIGDKVKFYDNAVTGYNRQSVQYGTIESIEPTDEGQGYEVVIITSKGEKLRTVTPMMDIEKKGRTVHREKIFDF